MWGFEKPRSMPQERILPSDVRYALQYREAALGPSEVLDLVRNGFEREATYMALKALKDNPEAQRTAIEHIASASLHSESTNLRSSLKEQVELLVPMLPPETKVAGMKLAQLSRQGFSHWEKIYQDASERYAKNQEATYLVGHSMFVGLGEFVRSHAEHEKPLHVLMPDFIKEPSLAMAGYRIEGDSVSFLQKDFERDAQAIVLDDMLTTGETTRLLGEFWESEGVYALPKFEYLALGSTKSV